MKKVVVLDDAAKGIEIRRDFYENLDPYAGNYFTNSILSDLDKLSKYSGIHPKVFGYHRMLATKFPFAIYYQTNKKRTEVVAILDLRRNPILNYTELSER